MPSRNRAKDVTRLLYSDDCLNVLNDELAIPPDSVDLIYLDPPFNSKNHYNLPFLGKDRDTRPVEAFADTWTWGGKEEELLAGLYSGPVTRNLADVVSLAQRLDRSRGGGGVDPTNSLAAYLLNMAVRLIPMRRVLKPTGSIYLHCDPTASHYLKLVMDAIFGINNCQNEVIWHYDTGGVSKRRYARKHDILLFYSKSTTWTFNGDAIKIPRTAKSLKRAENPIGARISADDTEKHPNDVLIIQQMNPMAKERLGYPTQKPIALLERVIKASSPTNGLVLDPFCGCGTTVHTAEKLGRRWIGIDISAFAVGLIRERILRNFEQLTTDDVLVRGVPVSVVDAEELAQRDKFEFEKWVCGAIGAEGMFHEPGTRGADGGVDGVLKFFPFRMGKKPKPEYAIVQVKGGNVTADSVRALKTTVDRFEARAGVMVCFNRYMRTVENQRVKTTFSDDIGTYPVIQGVSIEDLLADKRPELPLYGRRRQGGRISSQVELIAR